MSKPTKTQPQFVGANYIAKRYNVTPRYILQLAQDGKLPCLRLGPKCVRFNLAVIAKIFGDTL